MSTSTKEWIDPNAEIVLTMPHKDTSFGDYTICPAEVLLNGFQNKVGEYIEFCGVQKKVIGVTLVNGNIQINLK